MQKESSKPGVRFSEDERKRMAEVNLSEDEIKIIEVFRHVHYGHITIHKKAGRLNGRIEFKETY